MKLFSIPSTLGVRASGGRVLIALAVRLNVRIGVGGSGLELFWFLAAVIANQDD